MNWRIKAQTANLAMAVVLASPAAWLAGCGNKTPTAPPPAAHEHKDTPPHGGTPVVLGDFHLELVLDNQTGIMDAYVLDGEMENFVRISAENFKVNAKLPDHEEVMQFNAVANRATGETVGDTSMFEARAGWLKGAKSFDGVLTDLTIKGDTFTNVAFNFPKGNDTN